MSSSRLGKKFPLNAAAIDMEIPRMLMRYPAQEIARATGRSIRTVSNWLNGKTRPSWADGVRAMQAFPDLVARTAEVAGHKVVTDAQIEAAKQALKILEGS